MHAVRLAVICILAVWSLGSNAASLKLDEQDCARILQKWAEDPASVPQRLVDACKEKMTMVAPVAAMAAAPAPEAADPCAGPDAASSVLCWGPWASLAPATAAPVATLEIPDFPGDCEYGNEIDSRCVATIQAPLPIDGCTPGTPCGFATIVDGVTSSADVEETNFVRFDLAQDGTSFTVDPSGPNEVNSVEMATNVQPRPDGYENLRSNGISGEEQSRVIARVVRDDDDNIELAADIWGHGNRETREAKSGYFAWGTATTQSGLNFLNGNGVSVAFSGPMSVDNGTDAAMTVSFGSQPAWTGIWTNPAWAFGAGGSVSGVNLISDPGQFTDNVQAGSFVQGALLGEPGRQGLAHIIDVNLAGSGHIKDVGLLREVVAGPAPAIGP